MSKLIPMSAEDMQRRRGFQNPVPWYGNLSKTAQPGRPYAQSTRPVPSSAPTGNLVDAPYRGWDMTGLNTHIIPQADETQLALFSKYILRDPKAEPHQDLVARAQAKVAKQRKEFGYDRPVPVNIKQAYRGTVNGTTNMAPKNMTDAGVIYSPNRI